VHGGERAVDRDALLSRRRGDGGNAGAINLFPISGPVDTSVDSRTPHTLRFFADGRVGEESGRSTSEVSCMSAALRRPLRFEGGIVVLKQPSQPISHFWGSRREKRSW